MYRSTLAAIALCSVSVSLADDAIGLSADIGVTSGVFDRGEQLAGTASEANLAVESSLDTGTAYAALYRITPIGGDRKAFEHELDYTIGYAASFDRVSVDVSANWLTFPGEQSDSSLELATVIGLDAPLSPSVIAFYDVDLEDAGLELSAAPETSIGDWTAYLLGRIGFVDLGDGSPNRSYVGLEAGASYPFTDAVELGTFARIDFADEEAFADDISGGQVTRVTDSGFAAGVVLSWSN